MDYSKWDKWALEQSESDEEDDDNKEPVVTKFNGPARVTFGRGETVAEVREETVGARAASPARATVAAAAGAGAAVDTPVEITEVVETPAASEGELESDSGAAAVGGGGGGGGSESKAAAAAAATAAGAAAKSTSGAGVGDYTKNGGIAPTHYWSQTKDECVVRLFVPPGTRAVSYTHLTLPTIYSV